MKHEKWGSGSFEIEEEIFNHYYLLADGIYPNCPLFAKPHPNARTASESLYNQKQESTRKLIECVFGIVKRKWKVMREPCEYVQKDDLVNMVVTCFILHNMCVEYQLQDGVLIGVDWVGLSQHDYEFQFTEADLAARKDLADVIASIIATSDERKHPKLHQALCAHLWHLSADA